MSPFAAILGKICAPRDDNLRTVVGKKAAGVAGLKRAGKVSERSWGGAGEVRGSVLMLIVHATCKKHDRQGSSPICS